MTKKFDSLAPVSANLEKMAAGLQEVDIQYSGAGAARVTTKWYHGKSDADVSVWTDHRDNVIKQLVNISGNVVEWNILDGLKTGVIVEQEVKDAEVSESVRFDECLNDFSVRQALRMLKEIPSMDEGTKSIVLQNFQQPVSFSKLDPQEILFRYGRVPVGSDLSFWQKAKVYLRRLLS